MRKVPAGAALLQHLIVVRCAVDGDASVFISGLQHLQAR